MPFDPRHKSRTILEGPNRAGARAMMKAVGFTDRDLARPQIGVAHCWIETMPCNLNHRELAEEVKRGIKAAGGTPIEINHRRDHRRHHDGHGGHEGVPGEP